MSTLCYHLRHTIIRSSGITHSPQTFSRRTWLAGLLLGSSGLTQAQSTAPTESVAARETKAPALPEVGSTLHVPRLTLLDGQLFDPATSSAKVTVLYWWASTCPFCALQSPEMQTLWLDMRSKGLQMLTLSVDKNPQAASAYLARKGYTFPVAWVSPELHKQFPKPRGLPITIVLDSQGKVLQAEKGQMFAEDVAQLSQWL